ncbi:response regulator [Cellulomonas marina]|uniref:Two-component system, OmpR family, KDP operon response regulator KdpE n=1 Tax=Cellulomonas marina TaxID=988821 RepID=A0A1I1A679_9CELL|nr:response regulator [Cellulomonas marina]GIG29589.1 DNA-binding response regulator [Cellulomonas marina]SFB33455.1 two-component system, OmpR family, KDP operon response regulator KdpE [Cellulomonas marina]
MKILVADDDPQILRALRITLRARGYTVLTATDGADALAQAAAQRPDLYLVDLGMPRLDGLGLIRSLRGWTQAPVLVVSGRAGSDDKVEALDAGADDYVIKPFDLDELLARLRALARRSAPAEGDAPVVTFGDVTVDLALRLVTRAGVGAVHLTPTEWQVLEILVRNPGRLVTRQTILTEIWGTQHQTSAGYLRLYLSQLRKKLEPEPSAPRYLLTEQGTGYRFRPDPA